MKLALMLGYSGGRVDLPIERIKLAEQLGYHSVWTAEAYGSDAMTPPTSQPIQTESSWARELFNSRVGHRLWQPCKLRLLTLLPVAIE